MIGPCVVCSSHLTSFRLNIDMPRLAQYDYLFVFGLFFSFLDAFNIGANDVANS
jgi:hypothetical protein